MIRAAVALAAVLLIGVGAAGYAEAAPATAAWTVQVGPTASATTDYPPPQTRTVRTAWFAGDANSA